MSKKEEEKKIVLGTNEKGAEEFHKALGDYAKEFNITFKEPYWFQYDNYLYDKAFKELKLLGCPDSELEKEIVKVIEKWKKEAK